MRVINDRDVDSKTLIDLYWSYMLPITSKFQIETIAFYRDCIHIVGLDDKILDEIEYFDKLVIYNFNPEENMKNNKGFGLIDAMLSVSIIAISALAFSALSVTMIKNTATAVSNSDALAYTNQVRANIQNPVQASVALLGQNITSTSHSLKDPLNPSAIMAQAGFKQRPENSWSVSSVNFDSVVPVATVADLYRITLSLNFQRDQMRITGPSITNKVLGDVYCLAPANVITTCVDITSMDLTAVVPPVAPTPNPHPDDWAGRHYGDQHYNHIHTVDSMCGGH